MGVYTLCSQCVFFNQYNNLKNFFQIVSNCQKNPVVVIFVWVTFNYKKAIRFKIILNKLNCNYWALGLSDLRTIGSSDYWDFGLLGRHCNYNFVQKFLSTIFGFRPLFNVNARNKVHYDNCFTLFFSFVQTIYSISGQQGVRPLLTKIILKQDLFLYETSAIL